MFGHTHTDMSLSNWYELHIKPTRTAIELLQKFCVRFKILLTMLPYELIISVEKFCQSFCLMLVSHVRKFH